MAYPKGSFYHENGVQIIDGVEIKNSTTADIEITGGTIDEVDITGGTIDGADISNGTIDDATITGGTIDGADITTGSIVGTSITGAAFKEITVDCTDDYALLAAQKDATVIIISAAGTSKVLTLGMTAGQRVTITNAGANSVTVKNLVADTGVTATTVKTADFLITSGEIIKLTADV